MREAPSEAPLGGSPRSSLRGSATGQQGKPFEAQGKQKDAPKAEGRKSTPKSGVMSGGGRYVLAHNGATWAALCIMSVWGISKFSCRVVSENRTLP